MTHIRDPRSQVATTRIDRGKRHPIEYVATAVSLCGSVQPVALLVDTDRSPYAEYCPKCQSAQRIP